MTGSTNNGKAPMGDDLAGGSSASGSAPNYSAEDAAMLSATEVFKAEVGKHTDIIFLESQQSDSQQSNSGGRDIRASGSGIPAPLTDLPQGSKLSSESGFWQGLFVFVLLLVPVIGWWYLASRLKFLENNQIALLNVKGQPKLIKGAGPYFGGYHFLPMYSSEPVVTGLTRSANSRSAKYLFVPSGEFTSCQIDNKTYVMGPGSWYIDHPAANIVNNVIKSCLESSDNISTQTLSSQPHVVRLGDKYSMVKVPANMVAAAETPAGDLYLINPGFHIVEQGHVVKNLVTKNVSKIIPLTRTKRVRGDRVADKTQRDSELAEQTKQGEAGSTLQIRVQANIEVTVTDPLEFHTTFVDYAINTMSKTFLREVFKEKSWGDHFSSEANGTEGDAQSGDSASVQGSLAEAFKAKATATGWFTERGMDLKGISFTVLDLPKEIQEASNRNAIDLAKAAQQQTVAAEQGKALVVQAQAKGEADEAKATAQLAVAKLNAQAIEVEGAARANASVARLKAVLHAIKEQYGDADSSTQLQLAQHLITAEISADAMKASKCSMFVGSGADLARTSASMFDATVQQRSLQLADVTAVATTATA